MIHDLIGQNLQAFLHHMHSLGVSQAQALCLMTRGALNGFTGWASVSFFFLRNLCDEALGGEEEAGDGGGVLEGAAGHFGRVYDA
jgi:hypothetical protein